MKPKIFIGSSGEFLFIGTRLEAILQTDFEITIWDKAFHAGDFFLETLRKELLFCDLALFIIAPDDKLERRRVKGYAPRDNVLFELGMFVGALGTKKSLFLIVDVIKEGKKLALHLPTDLDGLKKTRLTVSLDEYNRLIENEANTKAIEQCCALLKPAMLNALGGLQLNLLPSTALAIGYYRNFILQACKELAMKKNFEISGTLYDLTNDNFDFYIVIPDKGANSSHEAYNRFVRHNHLLQVEIPTTTSPRPFPFFVSTDVRNGRLQLYDLPTTLRASRELIRMAVPQGTNKEEMERLDQKEIQNFKLTIDFLLNEPDSSDFRDNIHLVYASELASRQEP
jgi:hypothetical protein